MCVRREPGDSFGSVLLCGYFELATQRAKKAENEPNGETLHKQRDRWGERDKCKRLSKQDAKI